MEETSEDGPRKRKIGNDDGSGRFPNVPKRPRGSKRLIEAVKFVENRRQNLPDKAC